MSTKEERERYLKDAATALILANETRFPADIAVLRVQIRKLTPAVVELCAEVEDSCAEWGCHEALARAHQRIAKLLAGIEDAQGSGSIGRMYRKLHQTLADDDAEAAASEPSEPHRSCEQAHKLLRADLVGLGTLFFAAGISPAINKILDDDAKRWAV